MTVPAGRPTGIHVAERVTRAQRDGVGVVALESTLIAHGLPFPDNLAVARELEQTVRDRGAEPATIAIVAGVPTVGVSEQQIVDLARAGTSVPKTNAADMAVYMARAKSAATTVSATLTLAQRSGIEVFATGGIGGVHRGETGDVSHDLVALSQHPMAVVSAGAKAILDLARTLEMLETLGVLVVGYQTDEMPAFYTRRSGLPLEHRVVDAASVAELMRVRFDMLQQSAGVLVANPIPEAAAMDPEVIDRVIADALGVAEALGVTGKALTPFLLARIAEHTGGASVAANRALAVANAALGADIAKARASTTALD